MPFEKFKPPQLQGAIGTQVGKAQGVIIAKGMKSVTEATNKLRAKGCPGPAEMAKLDNKLKQLNTLSGTLKGNLAAFKPLPSSIKAPIQGLLAAIEVILALPVPQAIGIPPGPPGGLIFAQPTNFTTKFADLLNLLKEFAAAMLITATAIELSLKNVDSSVATIDSKIKDLEGPLRVCKIENAIKGKLTKQQQQSLGMLDENGESIFATFGSKVLEKENTRPARQQVEDALKEELGLPNVNFKGAATKDSLPKDAELNILPEGTAFRLPSIKVDGETVNEVAVVKTVKDDSGETVLDINGVPKKEIITTTAEIKPKALSGQSVAYAQIDKVLKNISDKLTQPDSTSAAVNTGTTTGTTTGTATDATNINAQQAAATTAAGEGNAISDIGIQDDGTNGTGSIADIPVDLLKEIKDNLNKITRELNVTQTQIETDPEFEYKGYTLRIQRTPESPYLAPRHFAVGIIDGKVKIKGPNSYSSSKEVLLQEIKFRIDNQLS